MNSADLAGDVVERLLAVGLRDVVVAPGSRSGPIALALLAAERAGRLRMHVRVDERSAAFVALGAARAAERPAAVLTTSGSAVANLHPAMLEAYHARLPLIALTADRPARLRGTGANQTTIQPGLLAPVPTVQIAVDRPWDGLLAGRGPWHLNVELDEPLYAPPSSPLSVTFGTQKRPNHVPNVTLSGEEVLEAGVPTVVIAGDGAGWPARLLAERAGWPLIAEPSSGARCGANALRTGRLLLRYADIADRIERVVVMGHPTLSRPVNALLGRADLEVLIADTDPGWFPHPRDQARVIGASPDVAGAPDPAWLDSWRSADAIASATVETVVADLPDPHPYRLARAVAQALPSGGLLVLGSSSPIRDVDLMADPWPAGERRRVIANRGQAGIDGTVSTAIGAALTGTATRAFALVGDLAFLHDANALLIGPAEARPDLTVVVAADDGGAIFSTLEQAAVTDPGDFERVFATPTGAHLATLCAAYGVRHHRAASTAEVATALASPHRGLRVVEVPLARASRAADQAAIEAAVRAAL